MIVRVLEIGLLHGNGECFFCLDEIDGAAIAVPFSRHGSRSYHGASYPSHYKSLVIPSKRNYIIMPFSLRRASLSFCLQFLTMVMLKRPIHNFSSKFTLLIITFFYSILILIK